MTDVTPSAAEEKTKVLTPLEEMAEKLPMLLGRDYVSHEIAKGELALWVRKEAVVRALRVLRDDDRTHFECLVDICGVDYPERDERFDIVYHLLSLKNNLRLRMKITTDEKTAVSSVQSVYPTAGWFEREAWDLFGIGFSDHDDLRRLLTDYNFEGHPLRKDFPLTGYVEIRYDNDQKRIVYEPVKLPQDYRSFEFTSPWEGMTTMMLPGDDKGVIPFGASHDPRLEGKKE